MKTRRWLRVCFVLLGSLTLVGGLKSAGAGEPEVASAKELDQAAVVTRSVDPVYPMNMRMAGLEGEVVIDFIIDRDGNVVAPFVQASNNPWFERPALDAIVQWKFKPGIKNGRPVNSRARMPFTFSLTDGGATPWRIVKGDQSKFPPEMQWDIAPEPVSTAFPVYPFETLQAGAKGRTRVNFVIGPSGRVVHAKVIEAATSELGRAVLAMLETWKFKPARKRDGSPCYAILSFEHNFLPNGRGDVPVSASAQAILRQLKRGGKSITAESELDAAPKSISRRPPAYPLALREAGEPGHALIEFYIDETGDAQLPRVVSASGPDFGFSAVQAVATWRFTPPKKGGKPVVTRARVEVHFNLKDAAD